MMSDLVIADVGIKRDAEGRYCLNDLHRASGSEKKHAPNEWLRNKQTLELIFEVSKPGIPGIQSKQAHGTFVCKELVYAYAMWISPAFHLKVIRAYDALVSAPQFALPQTFAEALQLAANQAKQIECLTPKAEAYDDLMVCPDSLSMMQAAKLLEIGRTTLIRKLKEKKILMADKLPYQDYAKYFDVVAGFWTDAAGENHPYTTTHVRPKGLDFIRKLLKSA
jgi:phage antirepressor YoqD-like protein